MTKIRKADCGSRKLSIFYRFVVVDPSPIAHLECLRSGSRGIKGPRGRVLTYKE